MGREIAGQTRRCTKAVSNASTIIIAKAAVNKFMLDMPKRKIKNPWGREKRLVPTRGPRVSTIR